MVSNCFASFADGVHQATCTATNYVYSCVCNSGGMWVPKSGAGQVAGQKPEGCVIKSSEDGYGASPYSGTGGYLDTVVYVLCFLKKNIKSKQDRLQTKFKGRF